MKMQLASVILFALHIKDNCTPLMIAAEKDDEEIVALLLRHKADINITGGWVGLLV